MLQIPQSNTTRNDITVLFMTLNGKLWGHEKALQKKIDLVDEHYHLKIMVVIMDPWFKD